LKKTFFALLALFLLAASGVPALAVEPVPYVVHDVVPTYFNTLEEAMMAFSGIRDQIATSGGAIQGLNLSKEALSFKTAVGSPISIPFASFTLLRLFEIPKSQDAYKWGLGAKISEQGNPVYLAAKSREAAEKMYSILASFAAAAKAPLELRDPGSAAVDPTKKDLKDNGLKEAKGGVVQWVAVGGPSEKAGLKAGDLILSINGLAVNNNKEFQEKVWPTIAPDKGIETYDLEILRKGTPMPIKIKLPSLETFPKPPATLSFTPPNVAPAGGQKQGPKLGFSLRSLEPAEITALNGKTGAAIVELAPGGEAEKAKMQVGDIIVVCNGQPVPGPKELGTLLSPGENSFTVIRKGLQLTFKINPAVASY
jgi:membrane-associated protease RseP (regulator of RpoE activity)